MVYEARRTTRLPRFTDLTEWSRLHLYAGGSTSAPGEFEAPEPGHLPCWPKREQFALVLFDDAYDASPGLAIPLNPSSRPPTAGDHSYGSRLGCPPERGGYIVPGLTIPVGYCWQNSRCHRRKSFGRNTVTSATSCRSRTRLLSSGGPHAEAVSPEIPTSRPPRQCRW